LRVAGAGAGAGAGISIGIGIGVDRRLGKHFEVTFVLPRRG
jgi:hypothetical protein